MKAQVFSAHVLNDQCQERVDHNCLQGGWTKRREMADPQEIEARLGIIAELKFLWMKSQEYGILLFQAVLDGVPPTGLQLLR